MRRDIQLEHQGRHGTASRHRAPSPSATGAAIPQTVALVANTLASFYVDEEPEGPRAAGQRHHGVPQTGDRRDQEAARRAGASGQRVQEALRGRAPQQMQANLATLEVLNTQLRLNSDNQVRAVERRQALLAQLAEADSFPQALAPRAAPRLAPSRRRFTSRGSSRS